MNFVFFIKLNSFSKSTCAIFRKNIEIFQRACNGQSKTVYLINYLLDLRLRSGRTINEGRIEHYWDGKWSPVCQNRQPKSKSVTEYCQSLGYTDGIEIQIENHLVEKNVSKCQDGRDLHIRCYSQSNG